jgi:hypothetical protein
MLGRKVLDLPIPKDKFPKEQQWDVFDTDWKFFLEWHVKHWAENPIARRYAEDDVTLTRDMWKHFGSPTPGDDNGELTALVGSARWRGWDVDKDELEAIKHAQESIAKNVPTAPGPVLRTLHAKGATWVTATNKQVMKALAEGDDEVARFARMVIEARSAEKRIDVCRKILHTGRAHFDFKVMGTLSGRMSGSSKLNPQGIPKKGAMRRAFTLAGRETSVLAGGDFDAFEVGIAAAVYDDAQLLADIQSGKKLHGLFGSAMFGLEYEEVLDEADIYSKSKAGVFATLYGAQPPKIAETLGLELDAAEDGIVEFSTRYPGVQRARQRIFEALCSMRQTGGIGSRVEWHEPQNAIASLLGFERRFDLENQLAKALFDTASKAGRIFPRVERDTMVVRRNRPQTIVGATCSALYAAAFNLQAMNLRAGANHEIQATGAEITKHLQRRLWDLQPAGVHPWRVQPMNIHDEVMCPQAPGVDTSSVVAEVLEKYKSLVPLIGMDWSVGIANWSER